MSRITFFLVFIVLITGSSSCKKINGKGDVVRQTRNITGFNGITLSMDAYTYIRQDTVYKVEILAQQNILDVIETPVEGGSLTIKIKNHTTLGKHDAITVYISLPAVNSLNISGSGTIEGNVPLVSSNLNLVISGSGNIRLPAINVSELYANISGSGIISASSGTTATENLNISGSGNIDLLNVVSESVYANISGSGSISVTANILLDGTISGSGNIFYMGNATVNAHISGSGSIIHL